MKNENPLNNLDKLTLEQLNSYITVGNAVNRVVSTLGIGLIFLLLAFPSALTLFVNTALAVFFAMISKNIDNLILEIRQAIAAKTR